MYFKRYNFPGQQVAVYRVNRRLTNERRRRRGGGAREEVVVDDPGRFTVIFSPQQGDFEDRSQDQLPEADMVDFPVFSAVVLTLLCLSSSLEMPYSSYASRRSWENISKDPGDCPSGIRPDQDFTSSNFSMDIRMPGVTPAESDNYLCISQPVPSGRDSYIVDFIPHANMDTVHHMLLFGCRKPSSISSYWDCGGAVGACEDQSSIMYAWGRNAPSTKLPRDVGFLVGKNSKMPYLVLQIHYGDIKAFRDHHRDCSGITLTMTYKPQPFIAGIYLLLSYNTVIPPGNKVTNADVACDYTSFPIYPFAFRTHTHHLGKVVTGYRVRNGEWTLIGRQSPQLPQAFYPTNKDVNVQYGDTVAARCMFTGENMTTATSIGSTSNDEMCNFYIMYYMDRKHAIPFMTCMNPGPKQLFQHIPAEANIPIPVSPDMMHAGHMMHSAHVSGHQDSSSFGTNTEQPNQGDLYSLISKLLGQSKDIDHIHKYRSNTDLMAHSDSVIQKKDLGSPNAKVVFHPSLMRDRIHKFHQLEATAEPPRSKLLAEGQDFHLEQVSWPLTSLQLGQVSGLAYNTHSYLVVFHRGDHRWGANSFNLQERYQERFLGPIQQSTILVVDPDVGAVMKASGRNMFYLPHGITTDKDNNYWLTDVALHQVFKVSGNGRDRILVALGEAFVPGSDSGHFCKPTDVAVDSKTGNVFVSDGYCNARILKFSPEGKYLNEWGAGASDSGRRIPFQIPHSLAFIPDRQELCVADRENGRIQCFIAETGEFVKEIKKEEFGGKVFAITYSPGGDGLLYAVNGVSPHHSAPVRGFVMNYYSTGILDTFQPEKKEFQMPHDIVESIDGVYVGDLDSRQIYKFTLEKSHRSVKKGGIDVQQLDELQVIVKAEVRPQPNRTAVVDEKAAAAVQPHAPEEEEQKEREASKEQTALPVLITVLLLVPLLLIVSTGLFICWRRNDQSELKSEPSSVGGIFGKIRGKAVGGLNLGNFFVSHRGYTRQGFDQLSTEGSDQERNNDSSDSEYEEFSTLPPRSSS
uniref:Peptidylglycine alpha-amidating monooxygenase n=1 Tax=Takifugu rubripes TaxID=31033 RepID=A0A674PD46_TAKRU